MVRRMLRTRSLKRKKVKTPGNKVVVHFEDKKTGIARCAICGKPLHGIPRVKSSEMRKLPKTKRRPERPYGGNLCSRCMRNLFRRSVTQILEKK